MNLLERVKKHVGANQIEYVLLDFFDTLVHRDTPKHEIVRAAMQQLCRICGISPAHNEDVLRMRLEAEALIEHTVGAFYGHDTVALELWRRLNFAGLVGQDLDEGEFVRQVSSLELELESRHLFACTGINEVLQYLHQQGYCLMIVSDYPFGKEVLRRYLQSAGVNDVFERIFVSCDWQATKAEGTLYLEMLLDLGISAERCLMIGDNAYSDVQQARAQGLNALHIPYRAPSASVLPQLTLTCESSPELPRHYQGFDTFALAIYVFCDRLYHALLRDGHSTVYFLSREGQALKTYFDLYLQAKQITGIKTEYLYVSRLSTYLSSLGAAGQERFATFHGRTLSELLKSLQVDSQISESVLEFMRGDVVLCDRTVDQLWQSDLFVSFYESARSERKKALLLYLRGMGIDTCVQSVALCDVGWKGTMQDHICAVLEGKVTVYGYYLGLNGRSFATDGVTNRKFGLLFDAYPYKNAQYAFWAFDANFYERLLTADHSATVGYRADGSMAKPILKQYQSEDGMYALIRPVQKRIADLLLELCDCADMQRCEEYACVLAQIYLDGIRRLSRTELALQRSMLLKQYENFMVMKAGKHHAGKNLSLINAFKKRKKLLKKGMLKDAHILMLASHVLTNKRFYLAASLARRCAARAIAGRGKA